LNLDIVAFYFSHVKRQKIKKQGSITMGLETDHFGNDLISKGSVYIFKVCGFAAASWPIVDDLNLNDFFF
jgi:hypothetical protein